MAVFRAFRLSVTAAVQLSPPKVTVRRPAAARHAPADVL